MNIEHLRRALKSEWLNYYRENRHWIIRLGVWVNYQGQRRPSASFILGALSTSDPQLIQLLPLVVDLNNNPDRIVTALGLNFNPEDELKALAEAEAPPSQPPTKMLSGDTTPAVAPANSPTLAIEAASSRPPLDTAQLNAHELPDRETTRSTQNPARRHERPRRKHQWD